MDLLTSVILGALQGATEFLPISSSGHLALAGKILGSNVSTGLVFEALVHFATMCSVLIYFRKKIARLIISLFPPYTEEKLPSLRLSAIIILGTIPAAVIGLAFEDFIERAFGSGKIVSSMLLVTAFLLLSTHLVKRGQKSIGFKSGFIIGLAQSTALMPGISRSGATISIGLFLKVSPAEAAEFSFLLSLPAVFGVNLLKSLQFASSPINLSELGIYMAGAVTAFIVGYLSIAWLLRIIKKGQFFYFGLYCLFIGTMGLIFL